MCVATVLVVEDDPSLREALADTLELAGFDVATADNGQQALEVLADQDVHLVVSDVQMSKMDGHALLKEIKTSRPELPVLLMTAYGTIQKAVQAMRDGAIDYLVKPFEAEVLVNTVSRYLSLDGRQDQGPIAEDARTRELFTLAERVAESDVTVMLCGESGTGKEVFARYIHEHSDQACGPFVAINCAAIPDNMLEAVLFGYEKGAFTGAYQAAAGKFEQAQGGTLLLDEVSEMDLGLQAKLLRVLQEREVERLGGRKLIPLDVRVLATTNRNLREEVAAGRFREDLFYRINVFPLLLPPLRERPRDILPLAKHMIDRRAAAGRSQPYLSEEAEQVLLAHAWPGNVRELENVIQRALILKAGDEIHARDLCFEADQGMSMGPSGTGSGAEPPRPQNGKLEDGLKSVEEQIILDVLREGNGSRKNAAAKLGISQRTLRYKLARMREAGVAIPG